MDCKRAALKTELAFTCISAMEPLRAVAISRAIVLYAKSRGSVTVAADSADAVATLVLPRRRFGVKKRKRRFCTSLALGVRLATRTLSDLHLWAKANFSFWTTFPHGLHANPFPRRLNRAASICSSAARPACNLCKWWCRSSERRALWTVTPEAVKRHPGS
jgi:hypothetical protein